MKSIPKLTSWLVTVGFVLLFPLLASAQENTLEVKCVDNSGQPVSGTKVFAQHIQTGKVREEKLNKQGVAQFKKLEDGFYRVLGRKEGFGPAYYEFVQLKGQSKESVQLVFGPGSMEKKLYFEDQALMQQGQQLLIDGIKLIQESKFPEAAEKLEASIEINPTSPDAHFNLAIAYIQQSLWEKGAEELRVAAKFYDLFIEFQPASAAAQKDQLRQSYEQANQILTQLPLLRLGFEADSAMKSRDFELAATKYQEIAKHRPEDADNYYNLALALANTKKYDEATAVIEKAIILRPDDKASAELKIRIAEHKEAARLEEVKKVLSQGDEFYNKGQYAEALRKYEEAKETLPEKYLPVLWSQMAKAHIQLNHPAEAVAAYTEAIRRAPDNTDYRIELAQYHFKQNRFKEGIEVYVGLFNHTSKPADQGLFDMGKRFIEQEKTDLARVAFEKVIEINPQYAEAYYELGMHYFYDKNDRPRARDLLTKYVSLGQLPEHLDNAKAVIAVIKKSPNP